MVLCVCHEKGQTVEEEAFSCYMVRVCHTGITVGNRTRKSAFDMTGDKLTGILEEITRRIRGWRQRLTLLTIMSHVFTLGANIGLVYQVSVISDLYFRYETKTAIIQSISGPIPPPSLCFCIRYTDLIHGEKGMKRAATLEERFYYQSKLTVKEIFELTPAANESVIWCTHRTNDSIHSFVNQETEQCNLLFNVSKFYTQDLICYNVEPLVKTPLLLDRVAHSLYFSHMMFGVRFSKKFKGADKIHIISFYGQFPWFGRNYASLTTRLADFHKMTFKNNKYYVSFLWSKHYLLPAPYDTNCSLIPIHESSECRKFCMIEHLIRKNKVPSSEFITEPIDLPHVNYHDLNDSLTRAFILRAETECSSRCDSNPCYTDITSTFMDANTEQEIKDQLITIWARIPLSPVISVVSSEALSLVEYLVYIGGCCGTWIGLSVMSFNPFHYKYYKCIMNRTKKRSGEEKPGLRVRYSQRNGHWMYSARKEGVLGSQ